MKGKFIDIVLTLALVIGIGMYADRNYFRALPTNTTNTEAVYHEDWRELTSNSTRPEAKLQLVVFSDYECPFCKDFHDDVLPSLQKRNDVGVSVIHYPLGSHPNARPAAEAAECARIQGKFWQLDSAIFANVSALATDITTYAKAAKVDVEKWTSCLTNKEMAKTIGKHLELTAKYQIKGTPGFIVNGWFVPNGSKEMFEQSLKDILQGKKPYKVK